MLPLPLSQGYLSSYTLMQSSDHCLGRKVQCAALEVIQCERIGQHSLSARLAIVTRASKRPFYTAISGKEQAQSVL